MWRPTEMELRRIAACEPRLPQTNPLGLKLFLLFKQE